MKLGFISRIVRLLHVEVFVFGHNHGNRYFEMIHQISSIKVRFQGTNPSPYCLSIQHFQLCCYMDMEVLFGVLRKAHHIQASRPARSQSTEPWSSTKPSAYYMRLAISCSNWVKKKFILSWSTKIWPKGLFQGLRRQIIIFDTIESP